MDIPTEAAVIITVVSDNFERIATEVSKDFQIVSKFFSLKEQVWADRTQRQLRVLHTPSSSTWHLNYYSAPFAPDLLGRRDITDRDQEGREPTDITYRNIHTVAVSGGIPRFLENLGYTLTSVQSKVGVELYDPILDLHVYVYQISFDREEGGKSAFEIDPETGKELALIEIRKIVSNASGIPAATKGIQQLHSHILGNLRS
eukprot:TRINITY_DN2003_c0_g1_i1.p1 TRINITY_DN2003_c0_g1~~TRINITY_DN2003_c0_g1_i1.p1  ORF type:complete len:202 (-),score=49.47 TRINITY_DN2003_c0_g1_i1:91-696(-)